MLVPNIKLLTKGSARNLSRGSIALIKKTKLPPRAKFNPAWEADIEEKYLHGGRGPGGQKINKCNSKVQLKHVPSNIVITCQATRSREQNRKIAREKLALELEKWKIKQELGVGQDQDQADTPTTILTEREKAIHEWKRQQKRSKGKKGRLKHELSKIEKQKQEEREMEEIKKLFPSQIPLK